MSAPSQLVLSWIFEYAVQCELPELANAVTPLLAATTPTSSSQSISDLVFLRSILLRPNVLPEQLGQALESLDRLTPASFDRSFGSTYFSVRTQLKLQAVLNCDDSSTASTILRELFVDVSPVDADSEKQISKLESLRRDCMSYLRAVRDGNAPHRNKFEETYSWASFLETASHFLTHLGSLLNAHRTPFLEQAYQKRTSSQHLDKLRSSVADFNLNGVDPMAAILAASAEAKADDDGEDSEPHNRRRRRLDVAYPDAEKVAWAEELDHRSPLTLPSPQRSCALKLTSSPVKKETKVGRQQRRVRWTTEEVDALVAGVAKYGRSAWKDILDHGGFLPVRTSVDLKDKWRNIEKERKKTEGDSSVLC